ncbi:MAG: Riboflavin transporter RfnT [Hyphomicrobiaceae bacterium hypho_1]
MLNSIYRNVTLLAICQAFHICVTILVVTTTPLAGYALLGVDKTLATLPFMLYHLGIMTTTVPASLLMKRIGRRAGFSLGSLIGILAGAISTIAIFQQSFFLLCLGLMLTGSAAAFALYYRFAATDTADDLFRPKAISFVLTGGIIASFLGPQTAKYAFEWFAPVMFAGIYVMVIIYSLLSLVIIQGLKIPSLTKRERKTCVRSMRIIISQPFYIVAILSSAVGYGVMALVMSATPLAMYACGFNFNASTTVIQAHVLGMFLPSFFTGHLIIHLGALQIIAIGALMQGACALVNASGIDFANFFIANIFVGVGWNFMYIGGSSLLTETYQASERAKVQASHDFVVFTVTVIAAGLSGLLQAQIGWFVLNLIILTMSVMFVIFLFLFFRNSLKTRNNVIGYRN